MAKNDDQKDRAVDFTLAGAKPAAEDEAPQVFRFRSRTSASAGMGRRDFLKKGLATGASVAVASAAPGCGKGGGGDDHQGSNFNDVHEVHSSHAGPVNAVAADPNGEQIVTAGADGIVKVWDQNGLLKLQFRGHTGAVRAVVFSPDGRFVASGGDDTSVQVWNVATGQVISRYNGHSAPVTSIAFSPTGDLIASASQDATVHIWAPFENASALGRDVAAVMLHAIYASHDGPVNAVAIDPTGTRIASGSDDGTCHVFDLEGNTQTIFAGHGGSPVTAIAWIDGNTVVSGDIVGSQQIFDASTGDFLGSYDGQQSRINYLVATVDVVASASEDQTVHLWDTRTRVAIAIYSEHAAPVNGVALLANGIDAVSGSDDRTAQVWRRLSAELEFLLVDPSLTVRSTGRAPGPGICTCDTVRVCSCDTVCTCDSQGGGSDHYWYPN
jgi:WD40 repeat protein